MLSENPLLPSVSLFSGKRERFFYSFIGRSGWKTWPSFLTLAVYRIAWEALKIVDAQDPQNLVNQNL